MKSNKMGSTLERPTMLMNKNFVQNTTTVDEKLDKGSNFQKVDMSHEK